MNVSRHATERYVERFLNVSGKVEIDSYIKKNTQELEAEIRDKFNQARLVYIGKIGGDMQPCKFYVHDLTCMVITADGKDTMKTVYPLKFPLPEDVQESVVHSLLNHIEQSNKAYDDYKSEVDSRVIEINSEDDRLDMEISIMEEKIKTIRGKKDLLQCEKKVLQSELSDLNNIAQQYAYQLFGNVYWKQECKTR
ncbi:MAG: hypothetical protein ACRC1P_09460 [Cellulosilyticaceae bacterium]